MTHVKGHKQKKEDVKKVAQAGAKGKIGAKEELAVTPSGDTFDTSKPIVSSEFSSRESFQQAEQIRGGSKQGFTPQGETRAQAERTAGTEARQKQLDTIAALEAAVNRTGTEELPSEQQQPVQAQVLQQPEEQGLGTTIKEILTGEGLERQAAEAGGTLQAGTIPIGPGGLGKIVQAGGGRGIAVTGETLSKVKGISKVKNILFGKSKLIRANSIKALKSASKFAFAIGLGAVGASAAVEVGSVVTKRFTAEDRRIKSIESDIGIMSEAITPFVDLARVTGSPTIALESIESLNDFLDDIDTYEKTLQTLKLGSDELKTNPEFTAALDRRMIKQRVKIRAAKEVILLNMANPQDPRIEELGELIASIE